MDKKNIYEKSQYYLQRLCSEIPNRSVASEGNIRAVNFFEKEIISFGWEVKRQFFEAVDWKDEGSCLRVNGRDFQIFTGPYSLGCDVEAQIVSIADIKDLQQKDIKGRIALLYDGIAKEQLMPKNFVFYNPEEHKKIISLLEKGRPAAIISATGRNPSLAGGVYPFPLIEDGDFNVPYVYMTEEEGAELLLLAGEQAFLKSGSKRIAGYGCNIIAGKGSGKRIVVTAHIDAKKGTPGAIDNATGVVTLLLLAELLSDYDGDNQIEIAAFNGEDYYSAPGQMTYIKENHNKFDDILLNINIDGPGYKEGCSAFSFYDLPQAIERNIKEVLNDFNDITEGPGWPQGDHSIFIQYGCPAIAVSSKWLTDNMDSQDITHTPKDNITIVDCYKLVDIARALNLFIRNL
ncbi:MAG: Zn-dependent exopeptidase M28 [bacterium]|nr:Zn-dependent exopeptidase M28 [bacterium]